MAGLNDVNFGEDPEGATPLDEEQKQGLKQSWIATREDLNQAEADNIIEGSMTWRRRVARTRPTPADLLTYDVAQQLHRDLFGQVWTWAGTYRTSNTNVGIDWFRISMAFPELLDNAGYWFSDPDTVIDHAVRLHHGVVHIHPFPNGNGRFGRELTDLVLLSLGKPAFAWGAGNLTGMTATRRAYIDALRAADAGDFELLMRFCDPERR